MLAVVRMTSRRFVRHGLVCVFASVALAVGCDAFQAANDSTEGDPSMDGSPADRAPKADAATPTDGGVIEAAAPDGGELVDASHSGDANVSPCLGKANGTVIGVMLADTCCDEKLTDLHTDDHCGGCNIKCGFNGQTHCTKAPNGVWACNECSTNDVCRNNGYGPSSTCYQLGTGGGGSGPNAYCQCQCPTLPSGVAGSCKGQCSDGMTCRDLGSGGNPNPCQYN